MLVWLASLLTSNPGDDENGEEVDDPLPGLRVSSRQQRAHRTIRGIGCVGLL